MIQSADQQDEVAHSSYDEDLLSGSLQSKMSKPLNAGHLDNSLDEQIIFDELSRSITSIPELHPNNIPTYLGIFYGSFADQPADDEPNPAIEAFIKGAKTWAKAQKLCIQDEVD